MGRGLSGGDGGGSSPGTGHPDENAQVATSPGRGCAVRGTAHLRMDP
jgi:hypothetical protein